MVVGDKYTKKTDTLNESRQTVFLTIYGTATSRKAGSGILGTGFLGYA
jgi:hypothetical protein